MIKVKRFLVSLLVALSVFATTHAGAAGGGGGGGSYSNQPSKLKQVNKALEAKQYNEALERLAPLYEDDPKDADVLNLIGFSYRKLGRYDKALEFYHGALALKPKHKGANEYLGQLYLETDQLNKAKERLAVLDKACLFTCKEYRSLKKAIKRYENGHSARTTTQ